MEENFILEELTTSGDKIPKSNCVKIDITISFTIGEKKNLQYRTEAKEDEEGEGFEGKQHFKWQT